METEQPQVEEKKLTLSELKERSYKDNFDQIVSDLKIAFSMDFQIEEACHFAHIHKDTYYEWLKLSDEFRVEMENAQSELFREAKLNIANAIKEKKDPEMSFKILERRQKSLYANRSELTGADGNELDMGLADLKKIAENTAKLLEENPNEPVGTPTPTSEGNN